ncbi:hypothetical protein [Streptomyces vinaceus]|uniref:hypothetical protein n=1 Tax=Streptomyces vinaceus TaxID=1960 RepID=UPI0036BE7003
MADPEVELLAAALRRDSADLDLYGAVLTAKLTDALPAGAVRVTRWRSLGQRLAGRPGAVAEPARGRTGRGRQAARSRRS